MEKEIVIKAFSPYGFVSTDGEWFNGYATKTDTKELNAGDKVKVIFDIFGHKNNVTRVEVLAKGELKPDFLDEDYVSFAELIKQAKEKNLNITTEMLEHDKEKRLAVFKATVTNSEGGIWTGHGDASPQNTNEMIAKHYLRMSETRSIARALRFALGEGKTAKEELENAKLPEKIHEEFI